VMNVVLIGCPMAAIYSSTLALHAKVAMGSPSISGARQ